MIRESVYLSAVGLDSVSMGSVAVETSSPAPSVCKKRRFKNGITREEIPWGEMMEINVDTLS